MTTVTGGVTPVSVTVATKAEVWGQLAGDVGYVWLMMMVGCHTGITGIGHVWCSRQVLLAGTVGWSVELFDEASGWR